MNQKRKLWTIRLGVCFAGVTVCTEVYESAAEEGSEWEEEAMALAAIYGDEATFPSVSSATIMTSIPAGDVANIPIEVR